MLSYIDRSTEGSAELVTPSNLTTTVIDNHILLRNIFNYQIGRIFASTEVLQWLGLIKSV